MIFFKYILLASAFALSLQGLTLSQQYWISQPCPTTRYLTKLDFVDSLYGWATGDSGTVIHTTDGGNNWYVQAQLSIWPIEWATFVNRHIGWALINAYAPGGTNFYRTSDGGNNWLQVPNPDSTVYFYTICFHDSLNGIAAGGGRKPYRTTDGGNNWSLCFVDSTISPGLPMKRVRFYDSQLVYACGGAFDYGGVMWKSTDGGLSWLPMLVSPEPEFDIKIFDASNVLAVGGDLEYGSAAIYTTNHGTNWSYRNLNCYGIATAIAFRTPSEAWVPTSFGGKWAVNTDSGSAAHWQCLPAPDSVSVYDVTFLSSNAGWAVGGFGRFRTGVILKYNTAIIGLNGSSSLLPCRFILYQNYPNPFNPTTNIKFDIPKTGLVKIYVYDVLGSIVATLVNEDLTAGSYKVDFNASNLSSGIYFYTINAGNFTETKKMMLIK
jgi:photosystem II stability/assembly factor-like uncharacterized protein